MAGIYIHIPFCRKACRYCDFHFTVSLSQKSNIVQAIESELFSRADYLGNEEINTVYFGGGTPSVLNAEELGILFKCINRFKISSDPEISFEANPDDLSEDYLKMLLHSGINRLSIGVQSFFDDDLALMRRSHNAGQAFKSIEKAQLIGFENITIDLIYGVPGMDTGKWKKNLETAIAFGVPHISAYHLTYEPGTVFDHWRKKGRLLPLGEEQSIEQFQLIREMLHACGYDHYEISNFARDGYLSKHNVNYWKQVPYLGVGPSAHSYNGYSRRWNIYSNKYVENVINGSNYYEEELLTEVNLYNEYIMTSLRTKWGVDGSYIISKFGEKRSVYFLNSVQKFLDEETVTEKDNTYVLNGKGIFIADFIISELFI